MGLLHLQFMFFSVHKHTNKPYHGTQDMRMMQPRQTTQDTEVEASRNSLDRLGAPNKMRMEENGHIPIITAKDDSRNVIQNEEPGCSKSSLPA